jgi:biotin operon repressor
MAAKPAPGSTFAALTRKQHEVLALVADNRTSKEIAAELGISESAVNQRIETVRSRLGGLPRAKMARDYRAFVATPEGETTCKQIPWQTIQLPGAGGVDQAMGVDSVSAPALGRLGPEGNGLQLSTPPFGVSAVSGPQGAEASPITQGFLIAAIVLAGMLAAYLVTSLVGIG